MKARLLSLSQVGSGALMLERECGCGDISVPRSVGGKRNLFESSLQESDELNKFPHIEVFTYWSLFLFSLVDLLFRPS